MHARIATADAARQVHVLGTGGSRTTPRSGLLSLSRATSSSKNWQRRTVRIVTDWVAINRRNARSVQTTIGWIFWDPGAVARFEQLGLPGPLGYIAARCAPLAGAGPSAVEAAFGSISPLGIALAFEILQTPERFMEFWSARDDAVLE